VVTAKSTVHVGVIGLGRIGKRHAEHIATRVPGAALVAVADINLAVAQAIASQFNVPVAVADYGRLLADPMIDAVVIASATDTHAEIAQQAAAAGKHIFCEKPIDFDLRRIDATLAAVERAGVKFQIGFNRRFDPSFRRVHELVAAGQLGPPHLLRITSRDPAPPPLSYIRSSGGLFLDMTIHDFDMARYLMGGEVTEIYAAGVALVDPEIGQAGDIDTAVITLHFANGALGTIDNSRRAVYGYDQRVELLGSEGLLQAQNMLENTVVKSTVAGVTGAKPTYFFLERYMPAYAAEWAAFVQAIAGGKAPPVTLADGIAALAMAEAATTSAKTGAPVSLASVLG